MENQLPHRGNERPSLTKKKESSLFEPNKLIPILTIFLFVLLVGVSLFRMFYQVQTFSDQIIAKEVMQLVDIFKKIDKQCKIIDFDYQKNPINFLNVIKFEGSEVGSMNLVYPKKWQGPYLDDNPTIQGKEYQIVRTKRGYFVTPGDGVVLSNGKVVGKDIILDEDADIQKMMVDKDALNFKGEALAAPLPIGVSNFTKVMLENVVRADDGLVLQEEPKGSVHLAFAD